MRAFLYRLDTLRSRTFDEIRQRAGQILARLERSGIMAFRLGVLEREAVLGLSTSDRPDALPSLHSTSRTHALLAGADRILANRFSLLGHRDLDFGIPTDWQVDPTSK